MRTQCPVSALCSRWLTTRRMGEGAPFRSSVEAGRNGSVGWQLFRSPPSVVREPIDRLSRLSNGGITQAKAPYAVLQPTIPIDLIVSELLLILFVGLQPTPE